MKKRAYVVALFLITSFIMPFTTIQATELPGVVYVDDGFNDQIEGWGEIRFSNIQEGINHVAENGTVVVYDGTYQENILVIKPVALSGTHKPTVRGTITIDSNHTSVLNVEMDGNGMLNGVTLNASYCLLSGCIINDFTIGTHLNTNATYNIITQCIFELNNYGIESNGNNNTIYLNNFLINTINAYDTGVNTWYNETLKQGNFWSNYCQPPQGAYDNNSDNIIDNPYVIPNSGNQDMFPLALAINLFPPVATISVSEPTGTNGWFVGNATVTLTASDIESAIAFVNFSIDGEWYQNDSIPVAFTLGNGIHTIVCYAVDIGGVTGRISSTEVKVDSLPPSIELVLDPALPDGINGWYTNIVYVSAVCDGTISPLNKLHYRIDAGGWQVYMGQFPVATSGNHTLSFNAVDDAGNEQTSSVSLKVDTVAPSTSLAQPNGSSYVYQIFEILWNATDDVDDNFNGNITLLYSPDNGTTWEIIAENINNTGIFQWNTYDVNDTETKNDVVSKSLVKIEAVDDAGNIGYSTSPGFILDNTPPQIKITQPRENTVYGSDVTLIEITWEAYDTIDRSLDGDITIEYYNGSSWHLLKEGLLNTGRYTFNAKDLDDGIYKIRVSAVDEIGNVGSATSSNFTVDTQPPSLFISRPLSGYIYINLFDRDIIPAIPIPFVALLQNMVEVVVIGSLNVELSASDTYAGIQRIEISADSDFAPLYEPPYRWEWNPSLGKHTMTITAYDNAGNTRIVSVENILCLTI